MCGMWKQTIKDATKMHLSEQKVFGYLWLGAVSQ